MSLEVFSGLVLICVVHNVVLAEPAIKEESRDISGFRKSLLGSSLSRLLKLQLQNKFKRLGSGSSTLSSVYNTAPLEQENLLEKRTQNTYKDYVNRKVQPSRMSYDPKDFAYKMSWHQDYGDSSSSRRGGEGESGGSSVQLRGNTPEFSSNQDKRRWRSGCDFSRVSYRQFVQFLKTGRICGRRSHRVRFGLAGKR